MDVFDLSRLLAERQRCARPYLEFLRVTSLSAGLYVLPAGGVDAQCPHTEDELYCVISGRGRIRVASEDRSVEAGTVIFVKAGSEHRFHTITDELTVLVFFAPAESLP